MTRWHVYFCSDLFPQKKKKKAKFQKKLDWLNWHSLGLQPMKTLKSFSHPTFLTWMIFSRPRKTRGLGKKRKPPHLTKKIFFISVQHGKKQNPFTVLVIENRNNTWILSSWCNIKIFLVILKCIGQESRNWLMIYLKWIKMVFILSSHLKIK